MKRQFYFFIIVSFLFTMTCVPFAQSSSGERFDLSVGWREIKTEHFYILHPVGYEFYGEKASIFVEDIHKKLVPIMGINPSTRTVIILSDQDDDHNGWATVFPYPMINVRLSPPDIGSSIGAYDNWLYSTLLHEYTHILNLVPAENLAKVLQFIFGPIIIPNGTVPRWHLEGLAVYTESNYTNGGRGNGTFFNSILRSAVNENLLGKPQFAVTDQLNENLPWWPRGNTPYLFGYEYYDYMVSNFDLKFIRDFNIGNAGKLPYMFEGLTKGLTGGLNSSDIFGRIWFKLENKFLPEIERIKKDGLTRLRKITDRNTTIVGPQVSPDGSTLAFFEYSPDAAGALKFFYLHDKREVEVKEAGVIEAGSQLAWSPDGNKIVFAQRVKWNYFYDIKDLYEFDLRRAKLERLSRGLRADYATYSHDGKRIFFVQNRNGRQYLAVRNSDGGIADLLKGDHFENIAGLRAWGRGGEEFILFVVKDDKGQQDIWLMDIQRAEMRKITDDWEEDRDPVWSFDGRKIFYSSNPGGVQNLFAIERDSGSKFQITNVIGGAIQPAVFPTMSEVAFVEETTQGYNLVETDIVYKTIRSESRAEARPFRPVTSDVKSSAKRYNPFLYLFPKWWLPWVDLAQDQIRIGGMTAGEDPLKEWRYLVNLGYDSLARVFNWSADVDYSRFVPVISASYQDFTNLISEFHIFQEERNGKLAITWPGSSLLEEAAFQPRGLIRSISFTNISDRDLLFIGGGLGILWNYILQFPYSVTREFGLSIEGYADRFATLNENAPSGYWTTYGKLRGYLPIDFPTKHSVLAADGAIGWIDGIPLRYAYFQIGGEVPYIFQGGQFLVRGYNINQFAAQKPLVGNFEWRIPLLQLWRGMGTIPLFLRQLYVVPFYDIGTPNFFSNFLLQGTGADLRFNLTFLYHLPVTLKVGVYRGIGNGGSTMAYVGYAEEF